MTNLLPSVTLDEDLHLFNETIAVACSLADRLCEKGSITHAAANQVIAVLNSSIYTLVFAMPPGSSPIQMKANGDILVTQKLEGKAQRR